MNGVLFGFVLGVVVWLLGYSVEFLIIEALRG